MAGPSGAPKPVPSDCPYRLGGYGRFTRRLKCPCGGHDLIESRRNCEYDPLAPGVLSRSAHVDLCDHSARVDETYAKSLKLRAKAFHAIGKSIAVHEYEAVPTLSQLLADVREMVAERKHLEKLVDTYELTLKAASSRLGGSRNTTMSTTQLCSELDALIDHQKQTRSLQEQVARLQSTADRAGALKAENERMRVQLKANKSDGRHDRRLARVMKRVIAATGHTKSAILTSHPDRSTTGCSSCLETSKFLTQVSSQLREARRVGV